MGRKSIITKIYECSVATDLSNCFCQVLMDKYPKRLKPIVERFEAYTGLPLEWSNINAFTLTRFKNGCKLDLAVNSVATTCAWMSAAINIYCDEHRATISKTAINVLVCPREKGVFAFATEDDIIVLIDFYRNCQNLKLRAIAAAAILEFYTGARRSDVACLTLNNIQNYEYIDKDTHEVKNSEMIFYTSQKTNRLAYIPISPIVVEILQDDSISDIEISVQDFDKYIKVIFKEIGLVREVVEQRAGKKPVSVPLNKCVASHTFRRSFATNLDRKGTDLNNIKRMMGHTNPQQTENYICGYTLSLNKESMKFFNK